MDQEGWRMAAVEHLGLRALIVNVDHDGGDEMLAGVMRGLGDLVQVPADALFDGADELGQGSVPSAALRTPPETSEPAGHR
jgi:hypothetical protein